MHAMPDCLDDESIAALAGGSLDSADAAAPLAHLMVCARCSREVASVARLLDAPEVRREIDRLGERPRQKQRRRLLSAIAAVGVLAAGLLFMFVPSSPTHTRYREESLTGAAAPRLVTPLGEATNVDAFRWTSVPRADRYRITVFARDGSVIWEAETRDTAIASAELPGRAVNDTILWRVAAHVGWEDRWTSSNLAPVVVHRAPPR